MTRPVEWRRLGFVPGRVLRVFGMRRSGNHAMADWLLRNGPSDNSVFLNNCAARRNPLGHFGSIAVNGHLCPGKQARRDLARHAAPAGDGALLLISYEDTSPAETGPAGAISDDFDERLIDSDLVFCRSFLNWSASLLKKLQANAGYSLSRRTAIVFRAIDTYTRLLGLVEAREELGLTIICYDDWLRCESYRAERLAQLGFRPRDNGLGRVQRYGGGSSFQKDALSPDELSSTRRWQQMADDPEYQALLFLAARDSALSDRLARLFPDDAARLASLPAAMTPPGAAWS